MSKRIKSQGISITDLKYQWKKKHNKISVIDIRSQMEYEKGRIPGSISVPVEKLMKHQHQLNKSEIYVLYSQSGNSSSR